MTRPKPHLAHPAAPAHLQARAPLVLRALRTLAVTVAAMVLALPVAFVAAVLLHPFWSWLEATTGLESMGRHGPADWCYGAVWGVMVLAALLPAGVRRARALVARSPWHPS